MSKKDFRYDSEALKALAVGVAKLEKAVGSTLGPRGRTCILSHNYGYPTTTKDGVSVAREVVLEDDFENIGALLVRQVAAQTADKAGDGTTTATVLANSIVQAGVKAISNGANPVELKSGIDKTVKCLVSLLKDNCTPCTAYEDIKSVGTISSNGDEHIGTIIADAMKEVGNEGVITIEEGTGFSTELDTVKGMEFDKGYLSSYFVTDRTKMKVEFDHPYIMLVNKKVDRIRDLIPLMETLNKTGRPLLVIGNEIEGDALQFFVMNSAQNIFKFCCVHSPGFGDYRLDHLQDLAAVTGGYVINEREGLKLSEVEVSHLGEAEKVIVTKNSTLIIRGGGEEEAVAKRADHIRSLLKDDNSEYDQSKLKQRLARLVGGVAVIKVGAETELEMKERKDRIEDAVCATQAAVEEGITDGGGYALFKLVNESKSTKATITKIALAEVTYGTSAEQEGRDIVLQSCYAPLTRLLQNAGKTPEVIMEHMAKRNIGYDVAKEKYCDVFKAGIIDPVKVTRIALQKAASVAGLLLTTSTLIHPLSDEKSESHLM